MATSGSVDFNQTFAEIAKDAHILVGGLEDDEILSAAQEAYAKRAINRLVKLWQKRGLKIWSQEEAQLPLSKGQTIYTLGPSGDLTIDRPIKIFNARRYNGTTEIPVYVVSRSEYMEQVNKSSQGSVTMCYYDPQLTLGELHVWLTPDNSTDELRFTYQKPLEDFDSASDNPYFPQEWLNPLVWNLAVELMPLYETGGNERNWIKGQAAEYLAQVEAEDDNEDSIFIRPSYR